MKRIFALALLTATAACGSKEESAPAVTESEPAATMASEPAASAIASAPAAAAPLAVKEGDALKVTKEAQCIDVGANASSRTMYPGVKVSYVGEQDGKAKVRSLSGKECLIAWDSVSS